MATRVQVFLREKRTDGAERVNLISDRCLGQNQNRMFLIMLSDMLNEFKFDVIEFTFLVPGHSQNENDAAHSVKEKYTRDMTIYTPAHWEVAIP